MKEQESNFNEQKRNENLNISEEQQQNFVEKYRNWIIGVSAAIILIFGGLYFLRTQQKAKAQEASVALGRIMDFYEDGEYEKALNGDPEKTIRGEKVIGLLEIVNKYSGTDQAAIAALYAGNSYVKLEDFKAAGQYFDKAKDAESGLVSTGALSGLALVEENQGNYEKAAKLYEEAAESAGNDAAKSRYIYYAGLCYEKSDKTEDAEAAYRGILAEDKSSEFSTLAKNGLARIGTKIE